MTALPMVSKVELFAELPCACYTFLDEIINQLNSKTFMQRETEVHN